MIIKKQPIIMIFTFFMCLIVGCSPEEQETKNPIITQTSNESSIDQNLSNEAVEKVLKKEEITKANAVNTENLLLVAFEVEQFERFNLKEIEKEIKSQLKKDFKKVKVEVTHDTKIMMEIEKLQDKVENENVAPKKWKKEIEKIQKLMKEKT
ncbi:hypothetical protein DCC39_02085 [Pueribacillus theae]|uniref:Sporulation protein n=1 Tax=Pueribacillus theae TaxID=2171751 RepID=A0A2U1K8A7_9BACI|nr:YhcN/YlaJ family sporulation lipoprotein [Pueribacillus theae]PWA13258.1 hypothetical protein DCC39_02085 [Pueribacillus theae]